jgi:hypothetical protein
MVALTAIHRSESERSRLGACGVDTVAFRFRPGWPEFTDRLLRAPHRTTGGTVIFDEKPGGIVTAVIQGVIRVEGRLDPLLTGDREAWGLRTPADVRTGAQAALRLVEHLAGTGMSGPRDNYFSEAEVARLDLAHEFQFDEPADGLTFLGALGSMLPAKRKTDVWRASDGTVQTVYFRSAGRGVVLERCYDKGVESGSHAAGRRVRFEAQRRLPKAKAVHPRSVPFLDLAGQFGATVEPYANAEAVHSGPDQARSHLLELVARGELSMCVAERLCGTIDVLHHFGRGVYADSTGRRRLAQLRKLGITPESVLPADRVVPVGSLLRAAVESWSSQREVACAV